VHPRAGGVQPPQVQKRYNITEVVVLEASIEDALAAAFGHGTPRFNLYKDAAEHDQGPHIVRMAPAFGYGPEPDYDAADAIEARKYLAEGKERSMRLLRRAISALEDNIAGLGEASASPGTKTRPLPSNRVFVVHGHDEAALQAVARFQSRSGRTFWR
jgi:hypothetical protein